MSCVTTTLVTPSRCCNRRIRRLILSATTGSRPDVGSSYNTHEGRRMMERARPTRFFIPPLKLSGILSFCPSISMTSSISSTFACSTFGSRSPASRSGSDVFLHCHGIKKRAALEKNAYFFADRSKLALIHSDNVLTINPNFARVRRHQSNEMFKQNAFAAAASSNNRECLTSCDLKINAAQDFLLPNSFDQ